MCSPTSETQNGKKNNYNPMFKSHSTSGQNISAREARAELSGDIMTGSSDSRDWGRAREGSPEEGKPGVAFESVRILAMWYEGDQKLQGT